MLVLTRNLNESIVINGDIIVKVIGIQGGQIRLGIEAPKNISVHREEIYEKIKTELCLQQKHETDASGF